MPQLPNTLFLCKPVTQKSISNKNIEYQTYEDSNGTYQWSRRPSYKLVNDQPLSRDNLSGYHYKGEVFEEMISLSGLMP
jgi:hypothetical protein